MSFFPTGLSLFLSEFPWTQVLTAAFCFLPQPVGGGMFGRSLAETVKFEMRRGGGCVPLIVYKCVDFIKAHGKTIDLIGVYVCL